MDIEEITGKYLSGSATEEEKKQLLQWLEEREENRKQFKKTYDIWLYSNAMLTDDNEMEAALSRLKERTGMKRKKNLSLSRIYFLRIAASLLLLLSAGYMGYYIRGFQTDEPLMINKLLTDTNGKGHFVLPDGSTVWLNANSSLEYPENFTEKKRIVRLEGEALFEVRKNSRIPFFVQAGGIDIEVTGTRFLVSNYRSKSTVETVLVNGGIKLGGDYFPSPHLLIPGQLITYDKNTEKSQLTMVNTDDYTNWIHSKLVFDKTNLANVIVNLKKWYGIEIIASPELTQKIHMSFTIRRESIEEVLKYMSLTAPITYKWEDDILYLSSKK